MDFKKIIDQVKDKAEARIKETRESLDKDHDGIPDAVQGLSEKAKTLAGQTQEKARDLAERAEAKIKETRESLDKDHDGIPDAVQGLSEKAKTLAAQAEAKLDKVKADAEKVVDSARERLKSAGKDDKKA